MKKRNKTGGYRSASPSPKSKWLTTILSLFLAGLLYLIIAALWFNAG